MNLFVPGKGFLQFLQLAILLKRSSVKTFLILKLIIVIGPCVGQFRK